MSLDWRLPDGASIFGGPMSPVELIEKYGLSDEALEIRRRCIASPLYLGAEVMYGYMPRDRNLLLRPSTAHREVEESMIRQESRIYVDHRGTLKTTVEDIIGTVWQLLKYPDDRVCLLQTNTKNATSMSKQVRDHFVRNTALRTIFPEYAMSPSDGESASWSVPCRRTITQEGSVTAASPELSTTGLHFEVIKASDLMNTTTVPPPCGMASMETMKSIISWYASTDGLLLHRSQCARAHRTIDSNRWHDADHVGQLLRTDKENMFRKIIRGVSRGSDGRFIPTWPEAITSEDLHAIHSRATMTPQVWAANFCSDPLPDGGMAFKREWFKVRGKDWMDYPADLDIATTCDPAFTDKKSKWGSLSDRSAIVTTGVCQRTRNLYVLHTAAGRWTPEEFLDQLFAVIRFWHPRWVGIEDTAAARSLKALFFNRMQNTGEMIPYREMKMGASREGPASKPIRMFPLHGHAQNKGIYVTLPDHEELVEELIRFQVSERDDLADAIAYRGMDLYAPMIRDATPQEPPLTVVPGRRALTGEDLLRRAAERARGGREAPWSRVLRRMA